MTKNTNNIIYPIIYDAKYVYLVMKTRPEDKPNSTQESTYEEWLTTFSGKIRKKDIDGISKEKILDSCMREITEEITNLKNASDLFGLTESYLKPYDCSQGIKTVQFIMPRLTSLYGSHFLKSAPKTVSKFLARFSPKIVYVDKSYYIKDVQYGYELLTTDDNVKKRVKRRKIVGMALSLKSGNMGDFVKSLVDKIKDYEPKYFRQKEEPFILSDEIRFILGIEKSVVENSIISGNTIQQYEPTVISAYGERPRSKTEPVIFENLKIFPVFQAVYSVLFMDEK